MGAAEEYPDGVVTDQMFARGVENFHVRQAREAPTDVDTRDRMTLTRAPRVTWIIDLAVIFAVALLVLFSSPNMSTYEMHRDRFFMIASAGTALYFLTAYWELRRRTNYRTLAVAQHHDRSSAHGPAGS